MFRWLALGAVSLLLIADAIGESGTIAPAQCTGLAKLALPDTKIVREEVVAPGSFLPPNTAQGPDYKSLPAFCRVIAEATPTPDSDIKMEIWLPVSGWNGKFRGQGNGGFAGEIDYSMLGASLSQGYATAGTDTGHAASGTDASWAIGHPEKVIDFGNRGIHEMTSTAKSVIDAYYGKSPDHSYFAACSDGGREALMEAQRFPDDYDGILAGAPAYYWTNMVATGM